MVMDAVEDYLENCAQVKVDLEVVESLLMPENLEISVRYILKHSTRRGSNIFQLFDTSEKPNNFVASRRRWLESQERCAKRVALILSTKELWQKAHCAPLPPPLPPSSTGPYRTPLPQQSSSSAREEEGQLGRRWKTGGGKTLPSKTWPMKC